jgi:hypothetical protein
VRVGTEWELVYAVRFLLAIGRQQRENVDRFDRRPPVGSGSSLTTSAVSRHTFSVQAAGAGSHQQRAGRGGRGTSAGFPRCSRSAPNPCHCLMTVLHIKHLFGHVGP